MTRLENRLTGLGKLREEEQAAIGRQSQEVARAQAAIGAPFPQQEALQETKKELDALIEELRTDKDDEDDKQATDATAAAAAAGPAPGTGAAGSGEAAAAEAADGGRGPYGPVPGPAPAAAYADGSGYQDAHARALAVLSEGPGGAVPDAQQFADWYARRYGHQDPEKWPLVLQAYADEWLPRQPDDHPLKQAAQAAPDTAEPAPQASVPDAWPAGHPFAADVAALLQAALADPDLALIAGETAAEHFALGFTHRDWVADQVAGGLDDAGAAPPFANAFFADPSLAAAVTATLGRQVYLAHADPAQRGQAATTDAFAAEAARRAARDWTTEISKARTAQCGCGKGCPSCALPRDRDRGLHEAITADMDLARAGIRHTQADGQRASLPAPGLPYTRTITWDNTADAYTVDIIGGGGDRFRLIFPGQPADWQVQAGDAPAISFPGTGTEPATRPAAVQYLLGLLAPPADTSHSRQRAAAGRAGARRHVT